MKRLAIMAVSALILAAGLSAEVQKKAAVIKAADGVDLKVTYFSPGIPGPAMLLLHQCNMDRHAWDGLAKDLAGAGFHVVTLDFRGFGESGGDKAQRENWPGDVDAAYAYLLAQKGVDKTHIAAGGASCGVTQSSDLATRHHEVKVLMFLSGQASDAARAYLAATPAIPVFGAASDGDTAAAKGINDAVGSSKNAHSTVKIYSGTEHGVPMFAKNPDLEPMIVTWLKTQMAPSGGGSH